MGDEDEEMKKGDEIKLNRMKYLDVVVDEIHSNLKTANIVIHCLAGAHRSPFITGCYMLKYGPKDLTKNPESIYKYLKAKRSIVQELGYQFQLAKYQQYLNK